MHYQGLKSFLSKLNFPVLIAFFEKSPYVAVIYLLWDCLYADLVNIWKLDFEEGLRAPGSWDVL